jgi:hypothetical protein
VCWIARLGPDRREGVKVNCDVEGTASLRRDKSSFRALSVFVSARTSGTFVLLALSTSSESERESATAVRAIRPSAPFAVRKLSLIWNDCARPTARRTGFRPAVPWSIGRINRRQTRCWPTARKSILRRWPSRPTADQLQILPGAPKQPSAAIKRAISIQNSAVAFCCVGCLSVRCHETRASPRMVVGVAAPTVKRPAQDVFAKNRRSRTIQPCRCDLIAIRAALGSSESSQKI